MRRTRTDSLIAYITILQVGCAGIALEIAGGIYQNLGEWNLQKVFGDELPWRL